MVFLYILLFILVLGLVVCIHELGHFYFARKAGILVNEFAFGMGPKIVSKKHGETYWSIRAFPIGGFCAMSGEEATDPILKPKDKVKLVFDEAGKVKEIITCITEDKFKDIPEVEVEKADLIGANMAPLYINDFEVNRNATIVVSKKEEYQIAPEERTFYSKSVWKRFMVCLGGPLNNILLAILIFLIMSFLMGVPNDSTNVVGSVSNGALSAGIKDGDTILKIGDYTIDTENGYKGASTKGSISYAIYNSPSRALNVVYSRDGVEYTTTIYSLYSFNNLGFASSSEDINSSNSEIVKVIVETTAALGGTNKTKAYQAENGLRNGDIVTELNYYGDNAFVSSYTVKVANWNDVYIFATSDEVKQGGDIRIKYQRTTDGLVEEKETGLFSIYSEKLLSSQNYSLVQKIIGVGAPTKFDFFRSIGQGFQYFFKASSIVFKTLFLLVTSKEVSVNDLGGFITILNETASYAAGGFISLLYFIGLLSVNLGIMNLLPIPALDGGRILFLFIEGVTKKKVNPKVETIIENVVFWLLMALIAYILVHDVIRLVIQLK